MSEDNANGRAARERPRPGARRVKLRTQAERTDARASALSLPHPAPRQEEAA